MRKIFIVCCMMCMTSNYVFSQDLIVKRDGSVIQAKVTKVGTSEVEYKKWNNQDGPQYSIAVADILAINYKNGEKETFDNVNVGQNEHAVASPATISEASQRRNEDIINQVNTFNPEYVGKNTNKACARVMCIMGISEDSQLVNDDIEITPVLGIISTLGFKGVIKKAVNADGKIIDGNKFKFYENTVVDPRIGYKFYSNPAFQIKVKNKTSKALYIDLGNTFFLRNGIATAYYVPSSTSSSSSSSLGTSVNIGAVAGALGIGGALGTLAGGIGVGGGATSGTVNTTYSQRIIAVPPMSETILDAMLLFHYEKAEIYRGLNNESYGSNSLIPVFHFSTKGDGDYKNGETHDFSQSTSPINFRFHVAYADNETCQNERNVSFNFYLRRLIGFDIKKGISKTDYGDSANKLAEVIPNFANGTFFVGSVGKASNNGFPRGDK